ncbi:MAG: Flp family type IVb pilin [Comamonadaceae bacterium]|nr:MAG: Flp family type IVb pilin [Comamonadaceae bacterium]
MNAVKHFLRDEEGATAIEYGVIAGLVTLALVVIFGQGGAFRGALTGMFDRIAFLMNSAV